MTQHMIMTEDAYARLERVERLLVELHAKASDVKPEWLSRKDAAERYGCSVDKISAMKDRGELQSRGRGRG